MNCTVRILRRLGDCCVGDVVAVQFDEAVVEGVIQFLARTPQGGWILTFAADCGTWEIFAHNGECSVVSQIANEAALWSFESVRTVADSATGRRFAGAR